jgi:hypothetical protein
VGDQVMIDLGLLVWFNTKSIVVTVMFDDSAHEMGRILNTTTVMPKNLIIPNGVPFRKS